MSAPYDQSDTGPVAKLVNAILLASIKKGALQIIVRQAGAVFVVEFEIDGQRREELRPPGSMASAIFERIGEIADVPKVPAGRTAHGRIHLEIAGQHHEFVVAVTRSRDRAHASIRAITAAELDKLD